jgi:hypothetical protein
VEVLLLRMCAISKPLSSDVPVARTELRVIFKMLPEQNRVDGIIHPKGKLVGQDLNIGRIDTLRHVCTGMSERLRDGLKANPSFESQDCCSVPEIVKSDSTQALSFTICNEPF